jgi:ABC-type transport system substrate-binding protein
LRNSGPESHAGKFGYNNDELNSLVDRASKATARERKALFARIQRLAMADPPYVALVFPPAIAAVQIELVAFGQSLEVTLKGDWSQG